MTAFIDAFKLVGAALGLAAFIWNLWSVLRSYLVLGLELREVEPGELIVKVSATNSSLTTKMISYAALLVTPEAVSISGAVERLLSQTPSGSSNRSNSVLRLFHDGGDERRHASNCVFIPLSELYTEQRRVGPGESVSYARSVDLSQLLVNTTHTVRFFVFISYAGVFIRWRITADAFRTRT